MSAHVSILGNLGGNPETRINEEGTFIANFPVASNTYKNTPQGRQKKTDWFRVTAIGKQAEILAEYAKKGSSILVRGKLTFNPWLDREGAARVSADVQLQDFEFAGSSPSRQSNEVIAQSIPATQDTSNKASTIVSEDEEENAEILAALHEPEVVGDEAFNGQF